MKPFSRILLRAQAYALLNRDAKYGGKYYWHDTGIDADVVFHESWPKNKCIEYIVYALKAQN